MLIERFTGFQLLLGSCPNLILMQGDYHLKITTAWRLLLSHMTAWDVLIGQSIQTRVYYINLWPEYNVDTFLILVMVINVTHQAR